MFWIIIIGVLILAFFVTPILMIQARQKVKEMEKLVDEFDAKRFNSPEEKEIERRKLKKELIKIKSGIVADKKKIEQAKDIIDSF